MGFTRSRRYANHPSGKKYAEDGSVRPQSPDALHCEKSKSEKGIQTNEGQSCIRSEKYLKNAEKNEDHKNDIFIMPTSLYITRYMD